ncbi:MAG: hypothetical protein AAB604_01195 [Patescibacteria group bacterium]
MTINDMFVGWEGREDEIFELAMVGGMGRPRYKALGNAFKTILEAAYEANKRRTRIITFPLVQKDSITKTALVLLTDLLHFLAPVSHQPFQAQRYIIT